MCPEFNPLLRASVVTFAESPDFCHHPRPLEGSAECVVHATVPRVSYKARVVRWEQNLGAQGQHIKNLIRVIDRRQSDKKTTFVFCVRRGLSGLDRALN